MIETGCCFCLSTKTGKRFRGIGVKAEDALQRDDPAGMALARAINDGHTAAPDFVQDLIIADAPVAIANIDFIQDRLESFPPLDVRKAALQQTI
jgi:hypothetical protein